MSLHPEAWQPVPAETARIAHAAFPKGHPYLLMRDEFPGLFQDEQFADLFAHRGRAAEAPWRLALVCLLQYAENLSDREAADAVRGCLGWKYLLGLELTDPGFDHTRLTHFRQRLITGSAELRLFETLLVAFRERKLLGERGTQRTDSTHVLAAVRTLNRLELVGETLRAALNSLAVAAPEWLRPRAQPEWTQRYGHRMEEARMPSAVKEREALGATIGADGLQLLTAITAATAPPWLREVPAVEILRQVWLQQFYRDAAGLWLRQKEGLPPAPVAITSPYDPEARYSQKRQMEWIGYKVHLTESCDPDQPLLITDVQTTPAPSPDVTALSPIQAALQERQLLPATHLVDAGYVDGKGLVASQAEYGIDLVGPAPQDTSWQASAGAGFAARSFAIDWAGKSVRCPAGKISVGWREGTNRSGPVIKVHFADQECAVCPHHSDCTRAERGRRLTLRPQGTHTALVEARARERTAEFAAAYAPRAGIEGTHAQGVRRCGLRYCRYVGMAKVTLEHGLVATALNFMRVAAWLMETPRARTRHSSFVRLMAPA